VAVQIEDGLRDLILATVGSNLAGYLK